MRKSKIYIIVIVTSLSFLVLSFLSNEKENSATFNWENKFFTQGIDSNEKNIFLIGSSMAAHVNQTYVEEHLKKNGQDYEVYNLGIPEDLPKWRINSTDMIISAKPDVIVYVMGFRDLRAEGNYLDGKVPFPIPQSYPPDYYKKVPYLRGSTEHIPISSHKDVQAIKKFWVNLWPIDTNDINAVAFKEIISKIRANNIQMMIVVNPHHSIYLDSVPDEESKIYFEYLDSVSSEYDIKIIDLHNKYSNLDIWVDLVHIGHTKYTSVYYEDIAKGILRNLN